MIGDMSDLMEKAILFPIVIVSICDYLSWLSLEMACGSYFLSLSLSLSLFLSFSFSLLPHNIVPR